MESANQSDLPPPGGGGAPPPRRGPPPARPGRSGPRGTGGGHRCRRWRAGAGDGHPAPRSAGHPDRVGPAQGGIPAPGRRRLRMSAGQSRSPAGRGGRARPGPPRGIRPRRVAGDRISAGVVRAGPAAPARRGAPARAGGRRRGRRGHRGGGRVRLRRRDAGGARFRHPLDHQGGPHSGALSPACGDARPPPATRELPAGASGGPSRCRRTTEGGSTPVPYPDSGPSLRRNAASASARSSQGTGPAAVSMVRS